MTAPPGSHSVRWWAVSQGTAIVPHGFLRLIAHHKERGRCGCRARHQKVCKTRSARHSHRARPAATRSAKTKKPSNTQRHAQTVHKTA